MKGISCLTGDREGLSKTAYVVASVVLLALVAFIFFGLDEPCGNGACDPDRGETCETCPSDCGPCDNELVCGDGMCSPGETCADCPGDCTCAAGYYCSPTMKTCTQRPCGDGWCDSGIGETCGTCPLDCGDCRQAPECGDFVCGPTEGCWDCPRDCKCGDGEYCSEEVRGCVKPLCGNGECEIFESSAGCCIDCPCELGYTQCNPATNSCESPPTRLGDGEIKEIVAGYYRENSMEVETITPLEVYVWGDKVGRKTEVRLSGEAGLKYVLVTDEKEVIVLPFF